MGVKIKKYIYKHNADIYLEKIQYSNNIIISLADLITSDYIVLLTNVLLVDYYKIVKDLNLLNINTKYWLKSNISDITISFAFLEHECEICLSLEKYNISDVIDYINYITS